MSFIHIPKTQLPQMFRTSRTDQSGEACWSWGGDANSNGVTYVSNNAAYGGSWWNAHHTMIYQLQTPSQFSYFRLFKGVYPTYSEIDAMSYIDTTDNNGYNVDYSTHIRGSDALMHFTINPTGTGVVNSSGQLVVKLNAGSAIQAGTATWFCLRTQNRNDQSSFGNRQAYTIFGTVGATGSGADIELLVTSISAGSTGRISSVNIALPKHITW